VAPSRLRQAQKDVFLEINSLAVWSEATKKGKAAEAAFAVQKNCRH